jgi:hypothetical protein
MIYCCRRYCWFLSSAVYTYFHFFYCFGDIQGSMGIRQSKVMNRSFMSLIHLIGMNWWLLMLIPLLYLMEVIISVLSELVTCWERTLRFYALNLTFGRQWTAFLSTKSKLTKWKLWQCKIILSAISCALRLSFF